ncbi:MAG: sigma 54-interacting transcriptional regulator [Candidatus Adiutrix sp.]|jgi:transcriptional regulator with PAS, ATPase and Fis domain|nr:sigma 54-interacting transcriptional regulator [Candidatus Adiutrix sp.]
MLFSIASYVTRCVSVVTRVTGIDVEVVDDQLVRIAGTGIYAEAVGRSIASSGQIYGHVLATGEPVFLTDSGRNKICQGCPSLGRCREKLTFGAPIKYDGRTAGVLGLVCFNDEDRDRVLANTDTYSYFVEQIAALIGSRLGDQVRLQKASQFNEVMIQVLDLNDRGIIVFNNLGRPFHINSRARTELGLAENEEAADLEAHSTGERFSEFDEFVVSVGGRRSLVAGRRHLLGLLDPDFSSILIFNTLTRFKEQISGFTSEPAGPGLDTLIGTSERMRILKNQIRQVAGSTSTVLITGESGTGTELAARASHAESDRRDKPVIGLNCGAIPDTLLESELFGYARGAFSGANPKGRIGKFELANHGVIFFDEIGTLPLYLQVKLLRVLQERQLTRLGSNVLLDIDVRVIAATNADLQKSIEQKMFREDLYYRLNVIPLELPALRDRLEDLAPLSNYFLAKYARLFNKEVGSVGEAVLALLAAYDWPGNVRELENVIEYAVNMMPAIGYLSPEYLPAKINAAGRRPKSPRLEEAAGQGLVEPLSELERRAIERALVIYGQDSKAKALAARALGIGVATLYRKIKEHNL